MMNFLIGTVIKHFLVFRKEVATLWRAFQDPLTPLHLKWAMVFAVFYLISPIDLVPEFLPLIGFVDDLILVPLMVSWIVSRLPKKAPVHSPRTYNKTIDGTSRRI